MNHRSLAEPRREVDHAARGVLGRGEATDDLHELHDGHRIHEVHADHAFGTFGLRADPRDGNGARVASEDGARGCDAIEVGEQPELEIGILSRRFNHNRRVAHRAQVGARPDAT